MSHPISLPAAAERVRLRRLRGDDLKRFQSCRLDPVVGRYQSWMPTSDDDAYSFLMQMNSAPAFAAGEWFQLGIADRESDLLIGDIGVRVSGDGLEAEIGFTLSRDSQGQGLAREAVELAFEILFATTEVGRIFAVTDARNTGANALLLSLGLGRMESRNAIFRNEPCIEHTYALKRGGVT